MEIFPAVPVLMHLKYFYYFWKKKQKKQQQQKKKQKKTNKLLGCNTVMKTRFLPSPSSAR